MRAVIYSRFSTDRQTESSIADQVRVCTEFAEREKLKLVERFEDQGISGAAMGNRPGLLKMLEASLARKFDVVLAADLSRLARSADLSKMIDRLVAKGIRVVGIQDGYDSNRKGHKLQAGLSGIIGEAFREMVKEKTYAALESRAKEAKPTGGRAYGYDGREINADQAKVVRLIFKRFVAGAGLRTIAAELNKKGVPSPGSTWARTKRRATGWMGSGVRVILRNEIYAGDLIWNKAEWTKDPDSGKRTSKLRPESEWIRHHDESLRIVDKELWKLAQMRIASVAKTDGVKGSRAKAGGGYVLSGLLTCQHCGANYVMSGKYSYACSSHVFGKNCENTVRLPRTVAQDKLVKPIYEKLLSPEETKKMVAEMQRYYRQRAKELTDTAGDAPAELKELEVRLLKLRARLEKGDPDMTRDEIQAVIDRAESKRAELTAAAKPAAQRRTAAVLALLPRAAERFRREIKAGLEGNPEAVVKARIVLRQMFGGQIKLEKVRLLAHCLPCTECAAKHCSTAT